MKKNSVNHQESNIGSSNKYRIIGGVIAAVAIIAVVFFVLKYFIDTHSKLTPPVEAPVSGQTLSTDLSQKSSEMTDDMSAQRESSAIISSSIESTLLETTSIVTSVPETTAATIPATTAVSLPLQGRVIGIDPGHQKQGDYSQETIAPWSSETKAKVSTGASGYMTGRTEESINLEIAFLLRDKLVALGAEVVLTRDTSDINISNQERAAMMNAKGVDACLRIHCNGANDHAVNGAEMYVKKDDPDSFALAELVLSEVCDMTETVRRSVYESSTYTGLNWSEVPCVLVELGFLSNAGEEAKLIDPVYQERYAEAMAVALQKWLEARS